MLFGFDATMLVLVVRPRSKAWRVGGAVRRALLFLVVAPAVAIVPPHAPWLIGAVVSGGILARRRLAEHFTLESLTGPCPNCGTDLPAKSGRLKTPHPVTCDTCHFESAVVIPPEVLASHGLD
jgi:predicted RNA-binding Zn-ribbon protein involved in translation (DUF1610 family)